MAWLWRAALSHLKPSRKALQEQGPSLVRLVQDVLAEVRDLRAAWQREAEQRAEDARRHIGVKLKLAALMDVLERLSAALEREEVRRQARAMLDRRE